MQAGGVTHMFPESSSNLATSWANKVKQTPKNGISSTTSLKVTSSLSSSTKNHSVHSDDKLLPAPYITEETEEVVEKKKRKRKKKNKSSDAPETVKSTNENVVFQEPPKFQDDEEFPDLISSAGGSERGNSSRNNSSYSWGPREPLESSKTKGSGKKSKTPVKLDLGDMLAALEHKQHTVKAKQSAKPIVLSVGGGIPVLSREPVTVTKHTQSKQGLAPHNPLDSSAPLVKKGKQREVPKAKKPTSLKKIILKEREQRKQLHSSQSQDPAQPVVEISTDNVECPGKNQTLPEQSPPSPHPSDMAGKSLESDDAITLGDQSKDLPDATEVALPIHRPSSNLPKIHSRRFREYCSQVLSKEVDTCVTELLKELVRFQDRLYLKDPVKAKAKRRLVMGLREVLKHLKLKKLKCIIISPNCEKIQSKGGLDDTLQTIINCACEQNVPFVFALNRKSLGRCVNKAVPVSVVGIFSYDGAQEHFHKLYELTMKAREAYTDMVASLQEQQKEDEVEENDLENTEQKPVEESTAYTPDDADEPNYIKVWKRMLEDKYSPYALSLEDTVANDMFNFHL